MSRFDGHRLCIVLVIAACILVAASPAHADALYSNIELSGSQLSAGSYGEYGFGGFSAYELVDGNKSDQYAAFVNISDPAPAGMYIQVNIGCLTRIDNVTIFARIHSYHGEYAYFFADEAGLEISEDGVTFIEINRSRSGIRSSLDHIGFGTGQITMDSGERDARYLRVVILNATRSRAVHMSEIEVQGLPLETYCGSDTDRGVNRGMLIEPAGASLSSSSSGGRAEVGDGDVPHRLALCSGQLSHGTYGNESYLVFNADELVDGDRGDQYAGYGPMTSTLVGSYVQVNLTRETLIDNVTIFARITPYPGGRVNYFIDEAVLELSQDGLNFSEVNRSRSGTMPCLDLVHDRIVMDGGGAPARFIRVRITDLDVSLAGQISEIEVYGLELSDGTVSGFSARRWFVCSPDPCSAQSIDYDLCVPLYGIDHAHCTSVSNMCYQIAA